MGEQVRRISDTVQQNMVQDKYNLNTSHDLHLLLEKLTLFTEMVKNHNITTSRYLEHYNDDANKLKEFQTKFLSLTKHQFMKLQLKLQTEKKPNQDFIYLKSEMERILKHLYIQERVLNKECHLINGEIKKKG